MGKIFNSKLQDQTYRLNNVIFLQVCMLAELVKTFPSSGQLCSDVSVPDANRKIFNDLLSDLKKALKKSSVTLSEGSRKEHLVLPLECHYLNKNAFMSVVGK